MCKRLWFYCVHQFSSFVIDDNYIIQSISCQKNVSSSSGGCLVGVAFLCAGLSRCVKLVCLGSVPGGSLTCCGMGLRRVLSSSSLNCVYLSLSEGCGLLPWPRLLLPVPPCLCSSSSCSLFRDSLTSLTAFCSHKHCIYVCIEKNTAEDLSRFM